MRVLIVSDIHANLEAFQSVLEEAGRGGPVGEVWCLGDTVGYGPDPEACLELLTSRPHLAVAGNHDLAVVGSVGLEPFNPVAAAAVRWTAPKLSRAQAEYLRGLPLTVERLPFTLVHGSPLDPVWDYFLPGAMESQRLRDSFRAFATPYCVVGHSHIPFACQEAGLRFAPLEEGGTLELSSERMVINPGSVGQPRDGDPRASFLVYDQDAGRLYHRRIAYDIPATQAKMRRAGLPERLAARLSRGV